MSEPFISRARARLHFPNGFPGTDEQLDSLIDSACQTIEDRCWRKFALQEHDEQHSGDGKNTIYVANPPIKQIRSIQFCPTPVLSVQNTNSSCSRANIQIREDRLVLTQVVSGVSTAYSVAFATYPTIGNVATAINSIGQGWTATVTSPYDSFASTDFLPYAGTTTDAKVNCWLRIYAREVPRYDAHLSQGEIYLPYLTPVLYRGYRVQYSGGFNPVPENICKVACELVKIAWDASKLNGNLASESVNSGAYSYSRDSMRGLLDSLSAESRATLEVFSLARPVFYKEGRR